MTTLKELDSKIKEALERQDGLDEALADPSEQGLLTMALEIFAGKRRWLNAYAMFLGVVFTAAGIFCMVRFFQSSDVRIMLMWGFGAAGLIFAVAALKLWFWMEMQTNSVLREVKRLELQVARLASKQG